MRWIYEHLIYMYDLAFYVHVLDHIIVRHSISLFMLLYVFYYIS